MNYYKHKDFIQSVYHIYKKNDAGHRVAIAVLAIMAKAQEKEVFGNHSIFDKIHYLNKSKNNLNIFDFYDVCALPNDCRLVMAKHADDNVFVYLGDRTGFQSWVSNNAKQMTFEQIKRESHPLSLAEELKSPAGQQALAEETPYDFESFIKKEPDSIEAKIKRAIDNLVSQSARNKDEQQALRVSIQKYRQDIRDYYNILAHQNVTDYDAALDKEDAISPEVDKAIDAIERNHRLVITNKVSETFDLINARRLADGLGATQKLKDEVEFVELKVKYAMALEELVQNLSTGKSLRNKTDEINRVINGLENDINDPEVSADEPELSADELEANSDKSELNADEPEANSNTPELNTDEFELSTIEQ